MLATVASESEGYGMRQLTIIKEYIDAKVEHQAAGLSAVTIPFVPESALTESQRRILTRFQAAEKALNEAIEADEWAVPE